MILKVLIRMRRLVCLAFIMVFAIPSWAAQVEENYAFGTTVMPEMLVGIGTRAIGMGGAAAACVNDLTSVYWNPAGLRGINHIQAEFNHNSWLADTMQETLLVGFPLTPNFTVAVAGTYFNLGTVEKTGIKPDGSILEENSSMALAAFGGLLSAEYGLAEGFAVGATVKYFQENLGELSPVVIAGDLGLQYQANENWSWGLALANLGTGVGEYGPPAGVRLGAALAMPLAPDQKLLAAADAEMILASFGQSFYHLGLEYTILSLVAVRVGYQIADTTTQGFSGLTAGLGFKLGNWQIGYAFAPQGDLGMTHRASVGLEFLPETPKKKVRRKQDMENPMSPTAMAFGTVRSPGTSGLGTTRGMAISKEEAAMRALLEKSLKVTTEIRQSGRTQEVVYHFRRSSGARVAKWALSLMDRNRKVVRNYKGSDLPDMLIWNGRDEEGEFVKNLEMTQYKLIVTDVNGLTETDQGTMTLGANRPLGVEEVGEEPVQKRAFADILFEVNRSEVSKEGAAIIAKAADYIKSQSTMKVYIEGYTDAVDEGDQSLVLSKRRAEAVVRYLTAYHNIPLNRILTRSRGIKSPAVSNDDPRQRYRNRRVVITVR